MILCLSEKEYLAAAKHAKFKEPGSWLGPTHQACVHTETRDDKLVCIVCLSPEAQARCGIEIALILVHEAVHVFQSLCDSIGENFPSREFEAYSIERITEQLLREYARRMQR